MVRYMVAVDESNNAKAAFYTTLSLMSHKEDELFIINVAEDLKRYSPQSFWLSDDSFMVAQEKVKNHGKDILQSYGKICAQKGINFNLLLGIADHVGEMICQAIDKKNIDFLIIGRRGMGLLKRLWMGSTSKYCVENANCNVLVIKGEWGPQEIHDDKKQVIEAEEKERRRRIEEDNQLKEEHINKMEVIQNMRN